MLVLSLVGCQPDEITIYKRSSEPRNMDSVSINAPDIKLSDPPKIQIQKPTEPEVRLHFIRKHNRECYPACTSPSTCNSSTGKCEAIANGGSWNPEKEHSATFLVDSLQHGDFDPRFDTYSLWHR